MSRTLLCYGDSNTHGTKPMATLDDIGRFGPGERWPGIMARELGDGWTVVEEGHPGRTTVHDDPVEGPHRNGLTILPAILESHRPIDVVMLMLGTNDLKPRFSVTAGDIALSLRKLAEVIGASAAGPAGGAPAILLVAPPPVAEAGCLAEIFEGGAAKSRLLGARIGDVALRLGLPFEDAGRMIAVCPLDGVHYDAETHAVLGRAMAAAVRRHFG
jgi:lysophospholipase L1-like esterase